MKQETGKIMRLLKACLRARRTQSVGKVPYKLAHFESIN